MGDRFEDEENGDIWEYIGGPTKSVIFTDLAICIKPTRDGDFKIGMVDSWNFHDPKFWTFIGNYAKSENFKNLYDLLNEPQ